MSKFTKVIYFRHIPLTEKIYEDFYMGLKDDLASIEFEYWDLSNIYFPNKIIQENSSGLINTRKFNSLREVEVEISNQDNTKCLYICLLSLEGRVRKLFHCFTKYNCIIAVFARNMFPTGHNEQTLLQKVKNVTFPRLKNLFQTKLLQKEIKRGQVRLFEFIFLGGEYGWKSIGRIDKEDIRNAKVININSGDYDNYLKGKECNRIVKQDYILFLDEYLPLHPDTQLFGMKNVSPEVYYRELNAYFDSLEKKFSKPVVIAAHPKALRYKTEDFFYKREVFFNKTLELVKFADLVLAHDSTSINYPVCFGKRIHFMTSNSIKNSIPSVHIGVLNFAHYLGCNYQFIDDNNFDLKIEESVPLESYSSYKFDFQTSINTQNTHTKDIFKKFLLT